LATDFFSAALGAGLDPADDDLATGFTVGFVEVAEAALAACLDGGDAFVTDFIASLTTGLALVADATLALDVEILTGAAGLPPDLVAAVMGCLGAGLAEARAGLDVGADLTGLAATADLVTGFFVLEEGVPFFTVAECLALAELFLDVACLPEDLVMMV